MPHDPKKSPLYQVLNILRDNRLAMPGGTTPVLIKLQDLAPALQYMPTDLSDIKKVDLLGEIIRRLIKNERTKKGTLLFGVHDIKTLDMFSKSYRANAEVIFIFSRDDLDAYIKYLIEGDKIRYGLVKKGLWFNKKTGTMEYGKIPSATQTGQEVRKITVTHPEIAGEPTQIAVNDDYENLFEIKPHQKLWKAIVTLSNNEPLPSMSRNEAKDVADYSLNKNNILYSKGHFIPTKLFKTYNGELLPVVEIEKAINTKTLKQRQTRQRKRA